LQTLRKHLESELGEKLDDLPEIKEDLEIFMEEILHSNARWDSSEDILLLYTRWAKHVPIDYNSDTISVISAVQQRENQKSPGTFQNPWDLVDCRKARYDPRSRFRKGSKYGNTISFLSKGTLLIDETLNRKNQSTGCSTNGEISTASAAMKSLAHEVALMQGVITNGPASGKFGYRRHGGGRGQNKNTKATASRSKRHLPTSDGKSVALETQNMLEYLLPRSFLNRVKNRMDNRCLGYWLFRVIFKGKDARELFPKSCIFTSDCTDQHLFLQRLASLCLLFPNIDNINKEELEKLWMEDDLSTLKSMAKQKASVQIHEELTCPTKEITSAIMELNTHERFFSYDSKNNNRKKNLILLRAIVFQKWMNSNSQEMIKLRKHVIQNINKRNGGHSSCVTTAKAPKPFGPLNPPSSAQLPNIFEVSCDESCQDDTLQDVYSLHKHRSNMIEWIYLLQAYRMHLLKA